MLGQCDKVVLDTNALFPLTLRDVLLYNAEAGLFDVFWSQRSLQQELRTNLLDKQGFTRTAVDRLLAQMMAAFPEATVELEPEEVELMKNDAKDRHVAAAAVKVGAKVIVTSNLADFDPLPGGVTAYHPDDFLMRVVERYPSECLNITRDIVAQYKRPPHDMRWFARQLRRQNISRFAARLHQEFGEGLPRRRAESGMIRDLVGHQIRHVLQFASR